MKNTNSLKMSKQQIIQQGAEAIIYKDKDKVIKKRLSKGYRHKGLDEKIRKLRTRGEARIIERASKIITVPRVHVTNENSKEIIMDFIPGIKLSSGLDNLEIKEQKSIAKEIGKSVSKLHESNIIHGDLTTSNMILNKKEVFFIDFGLSFHSIKLEDKAVDLHLFKQALEAKHFTNWKALFSQFLKGYSSYSESKKVLERLNAVEKRGRYKGNY